jgi:hypothetical protein
MLKKSLISLYIHRLALARVLRRVLRALCLSYVLLKRLAPTPSTSAAASPHPLEASSQLAILPPGAAADTLDTGAALLLSR